MVAYMDVDLSTDLAALLPLVGPLIRGHSDVAIGTRLAPRVPSGPRPQRETISRTYNLLLRLLRRVLRRPVRVQGGASRRARDLLPQVEDKGWFFDTELLVLAERSGLRIHEVPVDWVDNPDSRVDIVATARDDLRRHRPAEAGGLVTGSLPNASCAALTRRRRHRPAEDPAGC